MAVRRAIFALALVLAATAVQASSAPINGGYGCKALTTRMIQTAMMRQCAATPACVALTPAQQAAEIAAMTTILRSYSNVICTSCKGPNFQAIRINNLRTNGADALNGPLFTANGIEVLNPGFVVCQCAAGFGASQTVTQKTGKGLTTNYYKTRYGCSTCPAGQTTTITNQAGPIGGAIRVTAPGGGSTLRTSNSFTNPLCQ